MNSKQFTTEGIVLSRTDYNEADRILTFLTPDHGKVRAIAKAVRKTKSKLAGGIELFSISELTFVVGRGEIHTLISSRLGKHYAKITKDLDRTNAGYELIKQTAKATEDAPEPAYFDLLKAGFEALDNNDIGLELIKAWFGAQLLKQAGHTPNLHTDVNGEKLQAKQKYEFNFDSMAFQHSQVARDAFGADQIKFLRLLFSGNKLEVLQKIQKSDRLARQVQPIIGSMLQLFIRS